MSTSPDPLFASHPRDFQSNLYVYPVLSRRAGGISVGVNLNRDKLCNFHCAYCQVDRTETGRPEFVDLKRLGEELDWTVAMVASGRIFQDKQFGATPPSMRRLNDIAFSGDGEPTIYRNFAETISVAAEVRRHHALDEVKLVLITNASLLHREHVRTGLEILDRNNGEIWAKLDAGSEDYFRLIARSTVPYQQILDNIRQAAKIRPIVIQTLFMRINEQGPSADELTAYCRRLEEIVAAGGQIKLVQIYTVARRPAEAWVSALSKAEVDALAETVRRLTALPVAAFYG
jgi:wyosine [tRNA(Phe)-imidazoG37] synthetase (radical SAM superfamily)